LSSINCYVRETVLPENRFSTDFNSSNISLKNSYIDSDKIVMRSSTDKGSLVQFNNKNEYKDFSFEYTINRPNLSYPETIGTYFWFTENQLKTGDFHGTDGEFHGMVAGIEMTGRNVHLVIGYNDGTVGLKKEHSDLLLRDNVNPDRFKDVDEIKIKIISTHKNFKIELYNQDGTLIYDKLRFVDKTALGDIDSYNYIALTSDIRKVSSEKEIYIKKIKISSRVEGSEYIPGKSFVNNIEKDPRSYNEIDHPSQEVQHLISNLEHFMSYIKLLLGDTNGTPINQAILELKIQTGTQIEKVEDLFKHLEEMKQEMENNSLSNLTHKLASLDDQIHNLNRSLVDIRHHLHIMERLHGVSYRSLIIIIVAVGLIGGLITYLSTRRQKSNIKIE